MSNVFMDAMWNQMIKDLLSEAMVEQTNPLELTLQYVEQLLARDGLVACK